MIKVVKDKQKRDYELTYLLPAFFTSAEANKVKAQIEELIKKHKGELKSSEDWGKRVLAYKIKNQGKIHQEAVYLHLLITFSPDKVQKFTHELQRQENLLRYLLVYNNKVINKEG